MRNGLSRDRKTLYLVFGLVLVSVFTLTVAYAALNTILKITGNAEVVASSWDIYLDNAQVMSGSVNTNVPVITNKITATFSTTLVNPGDFYEFTIDVVNNGSIDAMIDSIENTQTLTESQAKYLNYVVEYQNGESINTKQLVEANSFVRLKVKVEFRKDLASTDLPSVTEVLNLSFKVNYVQADDSNSNVSVENNGKLVKIVSGDGTTTGDEVCIDEECFYVISSTEETVTMLARYNLHVGNKYDYVNGTVPLENSTGIQDETAKGYFSGHLVDNPMIGIISFSSTNYWSSTVIEYPFYVYNETSSLYEHVENYKYYLESLDMIINDARLITLEELENLGCSSSSDSCSGAPSWVYLTSYWSGVAYSSNSIRCVLSDARLDHISYAYGRCGIRPVIVIPRNLI